MSLDLTRLTISRNGWIAYAIAEVTLFAIANLTAKSSSHPGTVSNIAFVAFAAGLAIALLLGMAAVLRHRRAQR
jgi:hypothetical protein